MPRTLTVARILAEHQGLPALVLDAELRKLTGLKLGDRVDVTVGAGGEVVVAPLSGSRPKLRQSRRRY